MFINLVPNICILTTKTKSSSLGFTQLGLGIVEDKSQMTGKGYPSLAHDGLHRTWVEADLITEKVKESLAEDQPYSVESVSNTGEGKTKDSPLKVKHLKPQALSSFFIQKIYTYIYIRFKIYT